MLFARKAGDSYNVAMLSEGVSYYAKITYYSWPLSHASNRYILISFQLRYVGAVAAVKQLHIKIQMK
jgi:hypothetical protein